MQLDEPSRRIVVEPLEAPAPSAPPAAPERRDEPLPAARPQPDGPPAPAPVP